MPQKTSRVVRSQRRFLIIFGSFCFLYHQSKPAATPKLRSNHPVLFFMKSFLLDFWLHYKREYPASPSFELTDNLQFRHCRFYYKKIKKIEIRLPGAFLFPFLRECFFYCQGVWLNGGKKLIKLSFDCLHYIPLMCEEHG